MIIITIMNIRRLSPAELKEKISILFHTSIQLYSDELGNLLSKQNSNVVNDDIFNENDIRHFPWYQEYLFALRKMRMFHTKYCNLSEGGGMMLVTKKESNIFGGTRKKGLGDVMQTYLYSPGSQNVRLHDPKNLDMKNIEIMVENEAGYTYFSLPNEFVERLISYLELYKKDEVYDCNHFERHMLRVADPFTYHEIVWLDARDGNYDTIRIGDSIALYMSTSVKPIHKAIYLGNKLFISKLGQSIIGVSTLEQLHNIYETNEVALKRLFWESNKYQQQKEETKEILKNHPERERLEKVFASQKNSIIY